MHDVFVLQSDEARKDLTYRANADICVPGKGNYV